MSLPLQVFVYEAEAFDGSIWESSDNEVRRVHGVFGDVTSCPFCAQLTAKWSSYHSQWVEDPHEQDAWLDHLKLCRGCGWWRELKVSFRTSYFWERVALLERREMTAEEAPLAELQRVLATDWRYAREISAGKAEDLVRAVFRDHLDCEVLYTPNGVYVPDGGIDFVLVDTMRGIRYAFQVKRRLTDKPERIEEVRAFVGAVASSPYERGYYVTTADRFTRVAEQEVEQAKANLAARNIELTLVDGRHLQRIPASTKVRGGAFDKLRRRYSEAGYAPLDCWWPADEYAAFPGLPPQTGGRTLEDILAT